MKNLMILISLMLGSMDALICAEGTPDEHGPGSQVPLDFNTFWKSLRDISSGARGMLSSSSLNKLARSERLNYDESMIALIGFENTVRNIGKRSINGAEVIIPHIKLMQAKIRTYLSPIGEEPESSLVPFDQELQSSLTSFHDWLQTMSQQPAVAT